MWSDSLSVAAGESTALALAGRRNAGRVGAHTYGQTNIPEALIPYYFHQRLVGRVLGRGYPIGTVQAIAAGRNHNLALLTNGTVVAWGDNGFGQASTPPNISNVVAISAGGPAPAHCVGVEHVVVLGRQPVWPDNMPVGLWNVVAIAASDFHTLALQADGSVVDRAVTHPQDQLAVPLSVTHASAIASGYYHGLALVAFDANLRANLTGDGLVIQWNGSGNLQWSAVVTAAFSDLPTQGNSWTNIDMSAPAKVFRLHR